MQMLPLLAAALAARAATALPEPSQPLEDRPEVPHLRILQTPEIDCDSGEEVVSFDLLLDDHPEETGFRLTCEGTDVWSVKPGALADPPSEWITKRACVSSNVKDCTLTLFDTSGDGLAEPGWYSLEFGATSVAVYDGTPFASRSMCFGASCDQVPKEVADMQQECRPVVLDMRLDSQPAETSIRLVCDQKVLWNVKEVNTPFERIQLEECVAPYACCHFTVHDAGNDGLTLGSANASGYIGLEADFDEKIRYDGQDGMQFSTLAVTFGNDNRCSASEIVPEASNATLGDDGEAAGSFSTGAVVGSFFGGAVAAALVAGFLVSMWQSDASNERKHLFPVSPTGTGNNAEDGSKISAGEQMTAWSDADQSM